MSSREETYDAVCAVLTARGEAFRPADVYGFVAACWPTDDTPEEIADGWQESAAQAAE
jgi:hypothetical protein